jgi:hypothetical protein
MQLLLRTALVFATSIVSAVGQEATVAPTLAPTFGPTVSAPPACDWELSYYRIAESTGTACDGSRETDPIVVDGSCRFHPTVGYYEALCSDVGGTLVFALAHCQEGCINCQPFLEGQETMTGPSHYCRKTILSRNLLLFDQRQQYLSTHCACLVCRGNLLFGNV